MRTQHSHWRSIAQHIRVLSGGGLAAVALLLLGRTAQDKAGAVAQSGSDVARYKLSSVATEQVAYTDVSSLGDGWGDPPPRPRPE